MDKIKKISKYVVNALNMINMLILVLSPIWGWELDAVSKTIIGIAGVISTYLVTGKLFDLEETTIENEENKTVEKEEKKYDNSL